MNNKSTLEVIIRFCPPAVLYDIQRVGGCAKFGKLGLAEQFARTIWWHLVANLV